LNSRSSASKSAQTSLVSDQTEPEGFDESLELRILSL
jgi:hypothetical protein